MTRISIVQMYLNDAHHAFYNADPVAAQRAIFAAAEASLYATAAHLRCTRAEALEQMNNNLANIDERFVRGMQETAKILKGE